MELFLQLNYFKITLRIIRNKLLIIVFNFRKKSNQNTRICISAKISLFFEIPKSGRSWREREFIFLGFKHYLNF